MSLLPLLPGGPGGPGKPCLPGGPSCPFTPEAHKQAALLKLRCPMKTVTSHSVSFHCNLLFFSAVFYLQLRYFYTICDEDCSVVMKTVPSSIYVDCWVVGFKLQQMTQMKVYYMVYRGRRMQ